MAKGTEHVDICFEGTAVRVHSDAPEILGPLRRTFHWLLCEDSQDPICEITVLDRAGTFEGTGPSDHMVGASAKNASTWLQYQVIERFVEAHEDLLWLHGAAVAKDGRALVLPGRRGRGKSTLSSALWASGWDFITDDILPLRTDDLTVVPFPQMPAYREDPGVELPVEAVGYLPKTVVDVGERVAAAPTGIRALIFPFASRSGETALSPWGRGEATLAILEGCWNYAVQQRAAVETVATLVRGVDVLRVDFSDASEAVASVEAWASEAWDEEG